MNEKLTAYALNELPPDQRAELEAQMKNDPKLREEAEAMKAFCEMLEKEVHSNVEDSLEPEQRTKLVQTFQSTERKVIRPPFWRQPTVFSGLGLATAACVALMFAWREVKEASDLAKEDRGSVYAFKGNDESDQFGTKAPQVLRSETKKVASMDATPDASKGIAREKPAAVEAPAPQPAPPPISNPAPSERVTVQKASPAAPFLKAAKRAQAASSNPGAAPGPPLVTQSKMSPSLPTSPPLNPTSSSSPISSVKDLADPNLSLGNSTLNGNISFGKASTIVPQQPSTSSGTLTLSGANTYLGVTSVAGGTLTSTANATDPALAGSAGKSIGTTDFASYQTSNSPILGSWAITNPSADKNAFDSNGVPTDAPVILATSSAGGQYEVAGNITLGTAGTNPSVTAPAAGAPTVVAANGILDLSPTPGHTGKESAAADSLRVDHYNTAARRNMAKVDEEKAKVKMLNQVNGGPSEGIDATPMLAAAKGKPLDDLAPSPAKKAASKAKAAAAPEMPATITKTGAGTLTLNGFVADNTSVTAGKRAGSTPINPLPIDGLIQGPLVASADTAKKEVADKDRDELARQTAEMKKQSEELNKRSYDQSVQEAQRRVLEEKRLRERLNDEHLRRQREQQIVEQRTRSGAATYRPIIENPFTLATQEPLSTFSTDVDTASYANARRFLNAGERPPADAIRLEELVNYFPYAYPAPQDDKPLAVKVDIGEAPWQPLHRLARIAIKAREVKKAERPAANFTFLLDVSGSMAPSERLPLVKQALRLLVEQLREDDRVAIVTYAGESGLALESTPGNQKEKILEAINRLNAEGSTNGAGGIRMAYEQAVSHFKKNGINRIVLCTDGDFNVGTSNVEELKVLITEKAKTGVYLSVLGVGTDNLHDMTMQTLADCGNGNYHYLDSMSEARKVLVEQMTGNMITVAKDVKIQVEFNPNQVTAYRLIGYEKRMLERQDFNNDKKDAGDIGAGHTITALYEIVPADLKYPDGKPLVDDLKYNQPAAAAAGAAVPETTVTREAPTGSKETMTVKLRYKEPNQDKSKLMVVPVSDAQKKLSENDRDFQFATSVAGFGMLLRGSPYGNELTWDSVRQLALSGKGDDEQGWRGEFVQLIEKARGICER